MAYNAQFHKIGNIISSPLKGREEKHIKKWAFTMIEMIKI